MTHRRILSVLLLAAVPLLCKVPYMAQAWRSSPMDRGDLWLLPFALMAFVGVWRRARTAEPPRARDWTGLPAVLLSVVGLSVGLAISTHALQILSAILLVWGVWWICLGRAAAVRAVPAFVIPVLMTTSTTYWLCSFAGVSVDTGRLLKGALVLVCLLGIWRTRAVSVSPAAAVSYPVTCRRLAAGLLVLVVPLAAGLLYWWKADTWLPTADAFTPAFAAVSQGDWLAHDIAPSEGFKRFYGTSEARQVVFSTPERTVSVLAVKVGSNVHEVHPATHCLRTSGWQVLSERPLTVPLPDGRAVAVTEALVRRGIETSLSWVWYSNDRLSTGSFFCFRRHAHDGDWRTYQLRTSAAAGADTARTELTAFLQWQATGEIH